MPTSNEETRLTLARRLRIALAAILIVLIGPILVRCAPHIYHANFYKNPIADRTFSVDFEVEVEGKTVRLTRNYACDDQVKYTDFANTYYHQFPSNRIVSHRLQSGAGIYVAVPNACRYISHAIWKGAWCYDNKPYGVFTYTRPANCSGKNPVISGHVPMVIWTPDFDDPHTLYVNTTDASFDRTGSKIRKAEATITVKDGLEVSPPDAERWIQMDIHRRINTFEPPAGYFGITRHLYDTAACHRVSLPMKRNGGDLRNFENSCYSPLSEDGGYIKEMEGVLRLHREDPSVSSSERYKQRTEKVRKIREENNLGFVVSPAAISLSERGPL